MTPGAHRIGTPVEQIVATLRAERAGHVRLGGVISDRIRGELAGGGVEVNPERGTDAAPQLPPGSYDGHPMSGRARGAWWRRKGGTDA